MLPLFVLVVVTGQKGTNNECQLQNVELQVLCAFLALWALYSNI
jgi:hypothetical protein